MQLQAIKLAQAGAGAKATHTSAMVGDFEKVLGVETLKTKLKADRCADADEESSDW